MPRARIEDKCLNESSNPSISGGLFEDILCKTNLDMYL